jgi:hypothetical protein
LVFDSNTEGGQVVTLLWPDGEPTIVVSDATKSPRAFAWQGQTHQVQLVAERWRVAVEW